MLGRVLLLFFTQLVGGGVREGGNDSTMLALLEMILPCLVKGSKSSLWRVLLLLFT